MDREIKYTVLKNKDVEEALSGYEIETLNELCKKITKYRESRGKRPIECVVVESDWPEYFEVWSMIAARVDGVLPRQARQQQFEDYEVNK